MSLSGCIQYLCFPLITILSQITLSGLNFPKISIFDLFLFNVDLHITQFRQLLLQLLPQRIFFRILGLKLLEALVGLLERLSDVPILFLPHANGLILLGKRILV